MDTLELFSGMASFSATARERGHRTCTIDSNPQFRPDLCADVCVIKPSDIPFKPDIVWASPPCQCFSVAGLHHHWEGSLPLTNKAQEALKTVKATVQLIQEIAPRFFFIENPRGMLRRFSLMEPYRRCTITYCQYGFRFQKPTDIWTNCDTWKPKQPCKPGSTCHISAPRGSKTGTEGGGRSAIEKARVPSKLCEEILIACEKAINRGRR